MGYWVFITEIPGKCNRPDFPHDNRDGNEVACFRRKPWTTHPQDHYCRNCEWWERKKK